MRRRGELGEGGECASSSAVSVCVWSVRVCVLGGKGGRSVTVLLDVAERENREERRDGSSGREGKEPHGATSRVERQQFEC